MSNYYDLDIIPIILKKFKISDVIISGILDETISNQILNYCSENNLSPISINSRIDDECDFNEDILNILPNFKDYGAIFINDDPNWFTVYHELKIINETNDVFPLVFICNNIFPHKRRDSYINPKIIPKEYKNEYSKDLPLSNNIIVRDDFYHAINENTEKNGVLTAIEDFLNENKSIGIMDINLVNGITILYSLNSINHIRLGLLFEEIEKYLLSFDNLSDIFIENQMLSDYILNLNISRNDVDAIDEFRTKLNQQEMIIRRYEDKFRLHDDELNYKDSQIRNVDTKLSLKESQIKEFESKLFNRENEIDNLHDELQRAKIRIGELTVDIENQENRFKDNEIDFHNKIKSIKLDSQKMKEGFDKKELELNNKLQDAISQINSNEVQLKNNNLNLRFKDNQLKFKQKELNRATNSLNSLKQQYTKQLSQLDTEKYCISCYKEEIKNNHTEISYLKKNALIKRILSPFAYVYMLFKSNPKELSINFKLYKSLKKSNCFDIGYYLNNNQDILESKWARYFSPELHYICNGFKEGRRFNKKYYNSNSKKCLLDCLSKYDS